MRLTEIQYDGSKPVDGYGPGFFRVGGEKLDGPLTIFPSGIASWGGFKDTESIIAIAANIDVLFVGTGAEIAHVPADFRAVIEETGIGVEAMASPAACRTYNILLSEGRRVGLAVLPV